MVNKAPEYKCQWCKEFHSSYNFTRHLQYCPSKKGTVEDYINEFGEYRKSKKLKKETLKSRTVNKVICGICTNSFSTVGMHCHLRDTHDITIEQYIKMGYSDYRGKYIDYAERAEKNDIECLICQRNDFASHVQFVHHLREHKIKIEKYVLEYIFNNELPLCQCGCNTPVKFLGQPPYRRSYVIGHSPNGMTGKIHSKSARKLMSEKAIVRKYNEINKKNSKPELEFLRFLQLNNIRFEVQYPTEYGNIDFYLSDLNLFVEIDGVYWHPIVPENLNIQLVSSCISQKRKENIPNLVRIRETDVSKIQNINDLYKLNSQYDNNIDFYTVVANKSYFLNITDDEKRKCIPYLLKFLEAFQPEFPVIPNNENLLDITSKIFKCDVSNIKTDNFTFRQNCSTIGISYLKSNFNSYWKSSYKGRKSPIDVWKDYNIMSKIIEYRIGLNKNKETFHFTLHQMVRGISAFKHTISFFRPLLAAAIYYEFLADKENPIVLDPCAGFGGRLLGFKSKYPNGKYIGIEPNLETFNELKKLAENFTNIELYNCKIEDFILTEEVDLTFTSMPYYDIETYSNVVEYKNFEEWKNAFIEKLKSLPNLVINIPVIYRDLFPGGIEYRIVGNTTHFNKTANQKFEYLLSYIC